MRRSTLSQSSTLFIGMDVHTETIAVAYVAQAHGAEVTYLGTIGTRQCDLAQLVRQMPSKATPLIFVYEAGPCGSWLSRYRRTKDSDCWGVAPSLMPTKAGDRVTTKRRDAVQLAPAGRARVIVPQSLSPRAKMQPGAISLGRVRIPAALSKMPSAVSKPFCSDPISVTWAGPMGARPTGGGSLKWCVPHRRRQSSCTHMSVRFLSIPNASSVSTRNATRTCQPGVYTGGKALQALRGVPCTVAVTMVAELGALPRFDPPRALMTCLGLIPSAYSSGARRHQGAITQAGYPHARRALVAGAWAYRSPAKVSRHWP
jgi:transposase